MRRVGLHKVSRLSLLIPMLLLWGGFVAADNTARYLEIAQRGWNYELRTTMIGRDVSIPVHINGQNLAGAALCVVGDPPHALTAVTLDRFTALLEHTFGQPVPWDYVGPSIAKCGIGQTVILRFYSGFPPNRDLTQDVAWLNRAYDLGLPIGRSYAVSSPAMGQTFFGRAGQGTHIMVSQPTAWRPNPTEQAFYTSILLEELFQTFTFGMDVLLFEPEERLLSKLQERPVNLNRLSWNSLDFMRAMLGATPHGLCVFDVLMLHAVARTTVDQTTEPAFLAFVTAEFETLADLANQTVQDPRFAPVLDAACAEF